VQYAHKKGGICTMKKGNKKEGLNTIEVTDEMLAVIEQVQGRKAFEKEQAKQRNNGDRFVQLNTKILHRQSKTFKNIKDYQLMSFFYDKMNRSNALMVSQTRLCQVLDCHRNTLREVIKRLQELRYINVVKIGVNNCYVVNEEVAWKTGRDKKGVAIFSATVVAEWDDQLSEHFNLWTKPLQPIPRSFIESLEDDKEKNKLAVIRKKVKDYELDGKTTTTLDNLINEGRCEDTAEMFPDKFVEKLNNR